MHRENAVSWFFLMCGILMLSGCGSLNAPMYSFSPESVQNLKDAGSGKVRIGEFRPATAETETADMGMRGARFVSPYGTFSDYLREAIRQEFAEARRLSPEATTEVAGVVVKHLFNGNGISQGEGQLTARVTVKRDGVTAFDKPVTARITWESSFAGAVAIPRAVTEYPRLVREFIRILVTDADFINATK